MAPRVAQYIERVSREGRERKRERESNVKRMLDTSAKFIYECNVSATRYEKVVFDSVSARKLSAVYRIYNSSILGTSADKFKFCYY